MWESVRTEGSVADPARGHARVQGRASARVIEPRVAEPQHVKLSLTELQDRGHIELNM